MKTSNTPRATASRSKAAKPTKKPGLKNEAEPSPSATSEMTKISYVEEVTLVEAAGREITHHDIARMALRIYEEEGRPEGQADAHWFEAERRLYEDGQPRHAEILSSAGR